MESKFFRLSVNVELVDENDAGEVVATVGLTPVEFIGRAGAERRVAAYLKDVDRLVRERTAELEASKPNRAQRRGQRKGAR